MNRKILALNVALLLLLGTLGWMLREHWRQSRAEHAATLSKPPRPNTQIPPPSPVPPEPAVPAAYLEVAQKTLFSKDRNPNVIIEVAPPPPPKVEEAPPPLPAYFGQMGFDEPVALLSGEKGTQKGFRVGDAVGPFKLLAFDRQTITFEWHGKTLEHPLTDLKPKEPVVAANAPPMPVPGKPSAGPIIGLPPEKGEVFGMKTGESRLCVPGDKSPAGTVKDGYRKTIVPGPFIEMCQWEPIK